MKENNMEVTIKGLKCDTPGCGYFNSTIEYKDYKKYINKPCPICGGNLLTRRDYNLCKILVGISKVANLFPTNEDAEKVRLEGSWGSSDFKISSVDKDEN